MKKGKEKKNKNILPNRKIIIHLYLSGIWKNK